MRRAHWVILLALTAAVIAWAAISIHPRPEPVHHGKPLSVWVREWSTWYPMLPPEERAADAIHAMGPDALPFLLRWLRAEPRLKTNALDSLLLKVPLLGHNEDFRERIYGYKRSARAEVALRIFSILEPSVARAAVPTLAGYLNNERRPHTARRAATALANLGDPGLVPLLHALAQPRHFARQPILYALRSAPPRHPAAAIAAPLVASHTRDPDPGVAEAALYALGALKSSPQTSLPALTTALASPNLALRAAAARSLGAFGPDALPAIPPLLAALHGPPLQIQLLAFDAIVAINPELLLDGFPE